MTYPDFNSEDPEQFSGHTFHRYLEMLQKNCASSSFYDELENIVVKYKDLESKYKTLTTKDVMEDLATLMMSKQQQKREGYWLELQNFIDVHFKAKIFDKAEFEKNHDLLLRRINKDRLFLYDLKKLAEIVETTSNPACKVISDLCLAMTNPGLRWEGREYDLALRKVARDLKRRDLKLPLMAFTPPKPKP